MHSFATGVFQRRVDAARPRRGTLRAAASVLLTLVAGIPSGFAQQANANPPQEKQASALPAAPAPTPTEPFSLRQTQRDFSRPAGDFNRRPWKIWVPTTVGAASFTNSVRLQDLVKEGKIYLSLSDALALAIENNYDLAIARYNLDIADTDILRAKAGSVLRGVNSGVVANTLGGSGSTLVAGGGPGGSTGGCRDLTRGEDP